MPTINWSPCTLYAIRTKTYLKYLKKAHNSPEIVPKQDLIEKSEIYVNSSFFLKSLIADSDHLRT